MKRERMTISQAIEKLEGLSENLRSKGYEDITEALNMSVEALQYQINLGNMIFEYESDPEGILYSKDAVVSNLNDVFMNSEVNTCE